MPRSAGTYSLPSGNPVVTGTTISSAWANNTFNDVASALTQSLPRDGTAPPTANIPMGGFKQTGLGPGSALTDSVNFGQVQNSNAMLITTIAGADVITGSIVTPTLAAYTTGQRFNFVAAATNTTAVTININSLGAKAITKNGATALAAADLVIGSAYSIFYDGTQFQLNVSASPAAFIQAQTWTAFTTTGTSTAYVLTPSPAIAAYVAGLSFFVTFNIASGAAPTLAISGVATPPNLVKQNPDGSYSNISANDFPTSHRSRVTLLSATQAWVEELPPPLPRGVIDGFTMSTAGASATMSIAAGQATDSANAVMITGSAINKTTSAWAVGNNNGGIDTGSVALNSSYHFYEIRRPDTGVVDAIFSLNASLPALPTNYTQYRRIGSAKTNASSQWVKFTQAGDDFKWTTPGAADFNAAGSAAAASVTLNIPTGIRVRALLNVGSAAANGTYISDLADDDIAPTLAATPLASATGNTSGVGASSQVQVWTNTSSQVRHREINSNAIAIVTIGWMDQRGKNS